MTTTAGILIPSLDDDGKQIVVPFPATNGWRTWFTGAGDDAGPPIGRGTGASMRLSWDAVEARGLKSIDFGFAEPVELHDGGLIYAPAAQWGLDDVANLAVVMPVTATTANGGGTGNCNKVPSGLGYNVIVPAAGNGAHDVDLTLAVPIPSLAVNGYWDVAHDDGLITASASPGAAKFHLIDVEVKSGLVNNLPLGSPTGTFDVEVYKVEWFHQNWSLRLTVTKNSAGAGDIGGWLLCFRKFTQI